MIVRRIRRFRSNIENLISTRHRMSKAQNDIENVPNAASVLGGGK